MGLASQYRQLATACFADLACSAFEKAQHPLRSCSSVASVRPSARFCTRNIAIGWSQGSASHPYVNVSFLVERFLQLANDIDCWQA